MPTQKRGINKIKKTKKHPLHNAPQSYQNALYGVFRKRRHNPMSNQIKVPTALLQVLNMFLEELDPADLPPDAAALYPPIRHHVTEKLTAMQRREAFSAYKNATKGSADREAKRQEYLDILGCPKDFRTQKETENEAF